MRDRLGREITYLRISVGDRCDLRCIYCRSASPRLDTKEEVLSFEEIVEVACVASEFGVRRVRLTGGEPLLRRDIARLVELLRERCDPVDLSMTTNGTRLAPLARELARAGLDRVNVSLDSLRPGRYRAITRGGDLAAVLAGIDRAAEVGLTPVKINAVIMRDVNDDEIPDLARFALERGFVLRFIELMPVGEAVRDGFWRRSFVGAGEIRERLARELPLIPDDEAGGGGPARYFRAEGLPGKVGFITAISRPFCAGCNRLRVTATGELRPCLASDMGIPLRDALRRGELDRVREAFAAAIAGKPPGHRWHEAPTRTGMDELGG
ncbi:MAG: GTP 3',8-cyclase MoaA [Caldiserica bacterium]|nr:GTP 3',8-cyclase MoaA [Caldisericota bacterium]